MKITGLSYAGFPSRYEGLPEEIAPPSLNMSCLPNPGWIEAKEPVIKSIDAGASALFTDTQGLHDVPGSLDVIERRIVLLKAILHDNLRASRIVPLLWCDNNLPPFSIAGEVGGEPRSFHTSQFHSSQLELALAYDIAPVFPTITYQEEAIEVANSAASLYAPTLHVGFVTNAGGKLFEDGSDIRDVMQEVSNIYPAARFGLSYVTAGTAQKVHDLLVTKNMPLAFYLLHQPTQDGQHPWTLPDFDKISVITNPISDIATLATINTRSKLDFGGWVVGASPSQINQLVRLMLGSTDAHPLRTTYR